MTPHVILDHSIVGQSLTSLSIRKERRYAGCCICGALFQPDCLQTYTVTDSDVIQGELEIASWRIKHNLRHPQRVHERFSATGLAFSPEAAQKLAPFGLIPVGDALTSVEIQQAILEAPRAPTDDVEGSTRN